MKLYLFKIQVLLQRPFSSSLLILSLQTTPLQERPVVPQGGRHANHYNMLLPF